MRSILFVMYLRVFNTLATEAGSIDKPMLRSVFLGTRGVRGFEELSTHWAVGVGAARGELLWMELDGGGGWITGPNTINGFGLPWWQSKEPLPVMFQGAGPRSGAAVERLLGKTTRTDEEIKEFNLSYLERHPHYHLAINNCQDYVYDLVDWLVGSVAELPAREIFTYGALGAGGATAGGLAYLLFGRGVGIQEVDGRTAIEGHLGHGHGLARP